MDIIELEKKVIDAVIDEWMLAGHSLSGAFEKSLEAKTTRTDSGFKIDVVGNEYGIYASKGVSADKIPYSRGSGRGGKSKYITGLFRYVQARMGISDEREAMGVAFAIATKHKKEGMKGSGFLNKVKEKHSAKIEQTIIKYLDKLIQEAL
jgi:hypothetical protein